MYVHANSYVTAKHCQGLLAKHQGCRAGRCFYNFTVRQSHREFCSSGGSGSGAEAAGLIPSEWEGRGVEFLGRLDCSSVWCRLTIRTDTWWYREPRCGWLSRQVWGFRAGCWRGRVSPDASPLGWCAAIALLPPHVTFLCAAVPLVSLHVYRHPLLETRSDWTETHPDSLVLT